MTSLAYIMLGVLGLYFRHQSELRGNCSCPKQILRFSHLQECCAKSPAVSVNRAAAESVADGYTPKSTID